MALQILPEIAYAIGGQIRVTIHREQSPFPSLTFHDYFDQPDGNWGEDDVAALVAAKYADTVTFRLPESIPQPEQNP
jgi:hypothetical protein